MFYTVKHGDSLTTLAARFYRRPELWTRIANDNRLSPVFKLQVGQVLVIGDGPEQWATLPPESGQMPLFANQPASEAQGHAYLFVLADEINPLSRKVVRRIVIPAQPLDPTLLERLSNPEKFGFLPRQPGSPVSVGRHVLGMTNSGFISASEHQAGSPRFEGRRYWIDVPKVEAAGGTLIESDAIYRDLARIAGKASDARLLSDIEYIRSLSGPIDREVLIAGSVPPRAVKGAAALVATRSLQFVAGVGIILSAHDLGLAAMRSAERHSVRPLAAETVRQAGGWGGAAAGAEIGGVAGATVGIETGPGAALTAAAGALIFGFAGFFGASWIAGFVSPE